MTVRLLRAWNGYATNSVLTLDSATEAALVANYTASADLTGGTTGVNNAVFSGTPAIKSCEQLGAVAGAPGSTNQAAIQSAINQAGATSIVAPGTYEIASDTFVSPSGASLYIGSGVLFQINGVYQFPASLGAIAWGPGSTNAIYRTPAPVVNPPYRLVSFGDSRAVTVFSGTSIGASGSGTGVTIQRVGGWLPAYLGDTEIVGNFGISGDTLISASTSTGWNGTARANSKTISNCLQLRPDIVWIQYGINDIAGGATSANLIAAFKSFVSELIAGGCKVLLESIGLFDPTASSATIAPASAAAALVTINAVTAAMKAWCAGFPGRVAFVDTNPLIALSTTGYANPAYMASDNLGVHLNKRGAQLVGAKLADAARTLLPLRATGAYSIAPSENPNLIDWNGPTMFTAVETGSMTVSTPTWNLDTSSGKLYSGLPYAECVATSTALASGTSRVRIEIHPTAIAGATPTWPVFVGDVFQASAYLVIDDGAGGNPQVQSVFLRQRLYSDSKFSDFGQLGSTSDLSVINSKFAGRAFTTTITTAIASASISSPAAGAGFPIQAYLEIPVVGATARIRIYAPQLRVVSRTQPTAVTAGASPYTYYNGPAPFVAADYVNQGYAGRDLEVTVAPGAGGTISQIARARGPQISGAFVNAVNTGLTSGVFTLKPGDGLVVTWATTAAQLTVTPI